MAKRQKPILADEVRQRQERGVVYIQIDDRGQRGGIGDPPDGPDGRQPQSGLETTGGAGQAQNRELTVNAAEGAVPVIFGGNIDVGGYVIYAAVKQVAGIGKLLVDFALGEGPIHGIAFIYIDGKVVYGATSQIPGASVEVHLGVAGDTTSTLIGAVEPTYTIPEYIAHVAIMFPWPNTQTGNFDPFVFKATLNGITCSPVGGGSAAYSSNPVLIAHEMLCNPRFGPGMDTATDFVDAEWTAAVAACDYDIDPGAGTTKRWEIHGRIDSQSTAEDWINAVLDHCNGHIRYAGEKYGIWLDLPRAVAQDATPADFLFTDEGAAANLSAIPTVVNKGRSEMPTVVIVDFTEYDTATFTWNDQSVQVPDAGPSGDWIEQRYSRKWITTRERARRMATYLYNLGQLPQDISLQAWMIGVLPLVGDRVKLRSGRVLPGTEVPVDVSGAVAGEQHVVITDQTIGPTGVTLRASLYRDGTFSDVIDTSGGGGPPSQGGNDPDPPTDLVLTSETQYEDGYGSTRIKIEWTPADEPYTTFTRILYSYPDQVGNTISLELGSGFRNGPVYIENPVLGREYTIDLYTVRTSTGQVSAAAEDMITPAITLPAFIPVVPHIHASGNVGSVWWERPRDERVTATYGSSFWTNSGFGNFDAAKVNDGDVGGNKAFDLGGTGVGSTLTLDLGSGNDVKFGSVVLHVNKQDGLGTGVIVEYSDNGSSWTDTTNTYHVDFADTKVAYSWDDAGAHRYWRLRNTGIGADATVTVYEVQFVELLGAVSPFVAGYEIYDLFFVTSSWGPQILARTWNNPVPPTSDYPLDLNIIGHSQSGGTFISFGILAFGPYGPSIVRGLAKPAGMPGETPGTRRDAAIQDTAVGSLVDQTGSIAIDGFVKAKALLGGRRSLTLTNGNNNDIDIAETSLQIIQGPTGAFTITGIDNGNDGQRVAFHNPTTQTMTFAYNSGSSSAGNKIFPPGAADKTYSTQYATVELVYDGAAAGWYILDS